MAQRYAAIKITPKQIDKPLLFIDQLHELNDGSQEVWEKKEVRMLLCLQIIYKFVGD